MLLHVNVAAAVRESVTMELTRQRAAEIAEQIIELRPVTCDVRIFEDEDGGGYVARLFVELGDDVGVVDIATLIDQLRRLDQLLEREGLRIVSSSSFTLTLAPRRGDVAP